MFRVLLYWSGTKKFLAVTPAKAGAQSTRLDSGLRPLLSGMLLECVLKALHDKAVWVEPQPADSTIALAPKMASGKMQAARLYADACAIPCRRGFSRDGLRAIAAKAAPTFSSRGFPGSEKAFRTVVGVRRNDETLNFSWPDQ